METVVTVEEGEKKKNSSEIVITCDSSNQIAHDPVVYKLARVNLQFN